MTPDVECLIARRLVPDGANGRLTLLMVFLCAWAVVIVARLGQLMLFPGERLLAGIHRDAWVEGEIPAPRGCILDRSGRPLAWSTRHFSLSWQVPSDPVVAREEWSILNRYGIVGHPEETAAVEGLCGKQITLKSDLSAQDVAGVARLRRSVPGLDMKSWTTRHYWNDPALQPRLGSVQTVDGHQVGVSGAEKHDEPLLAGRPGRYRVMVDKDGKWIPETWQKTADVCPGYDVYLPLTAGQPRAAGADPGS